MFTSGLFCTALRILGIQHQRTQLNSPWQNGRIERFWATLKPALRQLPIADRMELQLAVNEFALFYNHVRTHRNLDGLTPAMVWRGQTHAEIRRKPAKEVVQVSALGGSLQGFHVRR